LAAKTPRRQESQATTRDASVARLTGLFTTWVRRRKINLFPAIETRIFQREDAKESAVDGLGLGRLVVIHVVIGELSANLRAFAPSH
jgi:hypothetical protein